MEKRLGGLVCAWAVAATLGFGVPALGQDDAGGGQAADDDVTDVIVVRGRRSRGMSAFEAGDYATAEIEFAKNARCALRKERNRQAALDQIQQNQIRQDVSGAGATVSGNPSEPGAAPPAQPPQAAPTFQAPSQNQGEGTDDTLDCGDRGFQIYMEGLSQLQLGKVEEAKKSFRQAGNLNRNLYDAQYRLGLIAILEGDEKEARWRLKAIRSILKRCKKRCDVRDEILVRRDHLEAALRGEVERGDG